MTRSKDYCHHHHYLRCDRQHDYDDIVVVFNCFMNHNNDSNWSNINNNSNNYNDNGIIIIIIMNDDGSNRNIQTTNFSSIHTLTTNKTYDYDSWHRHNSHFRTSTFCISTASTATANILYVVWIIIRFIMRINKMMLFYFNITILLSLRHDDAIYSGGFATAFTITTTTPAIPSHHHGSSSSVLSNSIMKLLKSTQKQQRKRIRRTMCFMMDNNINNNINSNNDDDNINKNDVDNDFFNQKDNEDDNEVVANNHNINRNHTNIIHKNNMFIMDRRQAIVAASTITATTTTLLPLIMDPNSAGAAATTTKDNDNSSTNNNRPIDSSNNATDTATLTNNNHDSRRQCKTLTLPYNGLNVMLVYDPDYIYQKISCSITIHNAGQYSDPDDIPGLAHCMEHMICSGMSKSSIPTIPKTSDNDEIGIDFDDWISDQCDGYFNAFTAYQYACYHFSIPYQSSANKKNMEWKDIMKQNAIDVDNDDDNTDIIKEALYRFATLFYSNTVHQTSSNDMIIRREISRIDEEYNDLDKQYLQCEYLTKSFINLEHPYSRLLSIGNQDTLQMNNNIPKSLSYNTTTLNQRLYDFYQSYYKPEQAVIVIVSNYDFNILEKLIFEPFQYMFTNPSSTVSPQQTSSSPASSSIVPSYYPGRFLYGNRYKHVILFQSTKNEVEIDNNNNNYDNNNNNNNKIEEKKKIILIRQQPNKEIVEKIILQWTFNFNYEEIMMMPKSENSVDNGDDNDDDEINDKSDAGGNNRVTGTQIAFVLSQIFCRKGRGSLYEYLYRRGWIIVNRIPKISLPVDTSGLQIVKLEILVTYNGFINRSKIISAIYDTIETLRVNQDTSSLIYSSLSYNVPLILLKQYAVCAYIFGYQYVSRLSNAVELSVDAQYYSLETIANDAWYRFPLPDDTKRLRSLQYAMSDTLLKMSDPDSSVIIVTANIQTLKLAKISLPLYINEKGQPTKQKLKQNRIASSSSSSPLMNNNNNIRWYQEPISGALGFYEDMVQVRTPFEQLVLSKLINQDELLAPTYNPLIPTTIRPPRLHYSKLSPLSSSYSMSTSPSVSTPPPPISSRRTLMMFTSITDRWMSRNNKIISKASNPSEKDNVPSSLSLPESNDSSEKPKDMKDVNVAKWRLIESNIPNRILLALLPKSPLERTCRSIFVIELLSSRPARSNVRQVARGELWRLLFDDRGGNDIAELGAPGGLSYDVSFNRFGLRMTFMGPSQTITSYVRRMVRRFVDYPLILLNGIEPIPSSIRSKAIVLVKQYPFTQIRKATIISNLKSSSSYQVAYEAIAFLTSCTGAVAFFGGDLLYDESYNLLLDIQRMYESSIHGFSSIITNQQDTSIIQQEKEQQTKMFVSKSSAAIPKLDDLLYKPNWKPNYGSSCSIPGVSLISDDCGRVSR